MSDLRKQADKTKKEYAESQTALGDEKKLEIDTQIDQQIATATADVEAKKVTAAEEYRSIIDTAAVQRELDRRQIAESMANMGLAKSGLNATQQTAVQLSAGNKIAAAQRQRQAAVDALTKSLAEYKMTAENTRRESVMAVDEATQKNIAEYNASVDKTVAEAETEQAKAQAEAAAAAAKSRSSILKNLYNSGAITPDTYAYAEDAGLSPSQVMAYQNDMTAFEKMRTDGTIDETTYALSRANGWGSEKAVAYQEKVNSIKALFGVKTEGTETAPPTYFTAAELATNAANDPSGESVRKLIRATKQLVSWAATGELQPAECDVLATQLGITEEMMNTYSQMEEPAEQKVTWQDPYARWAPEGDKWYERAWSYFCKNVSLGDFYD